MGVEEEFTASPRQELVVLEEGWRVLDWLLWQNAYTPPSRNDIFPPEWALSRSESS